MTGLSRGEQGVEVGVGQAVRVLALVLQPHQVDDVDEPDPEVGEVAAQQVDRGERLHRRHVAGAAP